MQNIKTSNWIKAPKTIDVHSFIIGDIHGSLDLLKQANEFIRTISLDINQIFNLIYLGDYIDRGPNSLGCLNEIFNIQINNCNIIKLMGNHEEMLLKSFYPQFDEEIFFTWKRNGGNAVLNEIVNQLNKKPLEKADVVKFMKPYVDKLHNLKTSVRFGDYVFVHAGVPFGYQPHQLEHLNGLDFSPLGYSNKYEEESPFWIRYGFIDKEDPWDDGLIVVHGHTIEENIPHVTQCRIGIDGGAHHYGTLTILELKNNMMRHHNVIR